MAQGESSDQDLLCVKNEEYPTSLDVRKVYRSLPDPVATERGFARVIDESGEDYLYPSHYFVAVELPEAATCAFARTS